MMMSSEEKRAYDKRRYADPEYKARAMALQTARRTTPGYQIKRANYRTSEHGMSVIAQQEKRNRERATENRRLGINLRVRLGRRLTGKIRPGDIANLIGCSIEDLRDHVSNKFQSGMSFANYGKGGWEIDHIIPLAKFDLREKSQVKQAFHYTNLQPLWSYDNSRKGYRT